jgi:hypothetical protein
MDRLHGHRHLSDSWTPGAVLSRAERLLSAQGTVGPAGGEGLLATRFGPPNVRNSSEPL